MNKREYKRRLKAIEKELKTSKGMQYILLMEEKSTIEYLIMRAV